MMSFMISLFSLKKLKRFKGGKNTCDVALGWIALKSRTEDALINEMNALVRLKIFRESNNMMTLMMEDALDDALDVDTVSPIKLTPTITIIINTNMIIIVIITLSLPWKAPSSWLSTLSSSSSSTLLALHTCQREFDAVSRYLHIALIFCSLDTEL